jgi:hypothetical protein
MYKISLFTQTLKVCPRRTGTLEQLSIQRLALHRCYDRGEFLIDEVKPDESSDLARGMRIDPTGGDAPRAPTKLRGERPEDPDHVASLRS